jgi:TonB dependent receptor
VVNEESWFPETDFVSSLRLRAGYGESGLRPEFRDAVTLYEPTGVQFRGADLPAVLLEITGNTALKPETTREFELGFDAGLFDDRLAANLTYYNRLSSDAIISVPLEPSFGLTVNRLENIGEIRNSGFELGLDARLVEMDDVRFNVRLATTTLDNEIESLGGQPDLVINRGEQRHREGFPAGGYFQDAYEINDDGDGLLELPDDDRDDNEVQLIENPVDDEGSEIPHYIGPSLPTLTNSLTADLTLFDILTISTLFDQRSGAYQLSLSQEAQCRNSLNFGDRGCVGISDPNASLEQQAAFIAGTFLSTRGGYIYSSDFVKWRELSFSLVAPESLAGQFPLLRGSSLTLSARNLAVWSDYPGADPEAIEDGVGNFNQSDYSVIPPSRYLTARLNLTF